MRSRQRFTTFPGRVAALAVAGAFVLPLTGSAQQKADFLFGQPRVTLGVHGGYAMVAGSDVFEFSEEILTLDHGDFHSPLLGAALGVRATERLDITLDVGFARSEVRSEYWDWVDLDDLPIEQTTTFKRVPVTLGAKFYLWDRGRSISRFAWVPAAWAPYVGGGGGVTHYTFRQEGDWVDYETRDIVYDVLESEGTATTGFLRGGADVSLSPRFVFNVDGRYMWAHGGMERDFTGFDDIDLGGFNATVGFAVRF